jgi:hypothetical protein
LKALAPILVTLLGIVTFVSTVFDLNALSPMLVTPLGIVTEVRRVEERKAEPPMLVTAAPPRVLGIDTVVAVPV